MKRKFTLTLVVGLWCSMLSAQLPNAPKNLSQAPKVIDLTQNTNFRSLSLADWQQRLGLPANSALVEIDNRRLGSESRRTLQQQHLGYPVEGAVYYVHYNNQQPVLANGELWQQLPTEAPVNLNAEQAIEAARRQFTYNRPFVKLTFKETETPQLVFTPLRNPKGLVTGHALAYKVDVYQQTPIARHWVYVSAETGKVLYQINRIHENEENGTANTRYSGQQAISTTGTAAAGYKLRSSGPSGEIITLNCRQSTNKSAAVDFEDADNVWDRTANFEDAAYDAHWGALKTLQYFKNEHNLSSYDGEGAPLYVYVHFDYNYDNAFWDGSSLTFGDGSNATGGFTPLTCLDVVAHEFGHGVTEFSANLVYAYESGALNESFSDIFGAAVEAYVKPNTTNNFLVGEEIRVGGGALRSMSNPNQYNNPDTYLGNFYHTGDGGGVHTNSGVQNHWYYLLSQGGSGTNDLGNTYTVQGIGMEKATAIAYRNLTTYLTPNATYADAAFFAQQAAQDLYGACSFEVEQTANAWYAVGVIEEPTFETRANFSASTTFSCTLDAEIQFTNTSQWAGSYLWNFGDGNTSTQASPTHTYSRAGTYTISLTAYPDGTCGTTQHTTTFSNYVTVEDGEGPIGANCIPQLAETCCDVGIRSFILGSINSTLHNWQQGYTDLTCQQQTRTYSGDRLSFEALTGTQYPEQFVLYIDWNNNGTFEGSEQVYYQPNHTTRHSAAIAVPSNAVKNVPLRVRARSSAYGENITNGCDQIMYGEVQDYALTVSTATNTQPTANFIVPEETHIGQAIQLTDASVGGITSWRWTFEGGSPATSTQRDPMVTFSSAGQKQITLVVTNAAGQHQITKQINVTDELLMCQTSSSQSPIGTLYDSGGKDGNYSNNENCSFLYSPAGLTNCGEVDITVNIFGIESCCDYLTIYDGPNAQSPQLYRSNGTASNVRLVAKSGQFYVRWTSDYSVVSNGYSIAWQANLEETDDIISDFSLSTNNPAFNEPVVFNNLSENATWYRWNFGDGTTSAEVNPTHAYQQAGNFTVTLISGGCGNQQESRNRNLVVQQPANLSMPRTDYTYRLANGTTYTDGLDLNNSGQGELVWRLGSAGVGNKILVYTYGSHISVYQHIADSLSLRYGSQAVELSNANTYSSMQSALANVGVLVIPYQEITPSANTTQAIREWANQGGTVVFWGTLNLYGYNLLDVNTTNIALETGINLRVDTSNHPWLANTRQPYTLNNYLLAIHQFNEPEMTKVLTYSDNQGTWDALGYKNYGDGKVVFAGFLSEVDNLWPPYAYQILHNIINTSGSGTFSSDWLTFTKTNGRLAGRTNEPLSFTVNPKNLPEGNHYQIVNLVSNDQDLPSIQLRFNLAVSNHMMQDFSYTMADSCGSGTVVFNNHSSMVNGGSYTWDFGDGTTSTEDAPVHQYNLPGTYHVKLKAYQNNTLIGQKAKDAETLFLMAEPTMPDSVHLGYEMDYLGNVYGNFDYALWSFGDGYYVNMADAKHTYYQKGKYQLSFTAENDEGCSITYQQEVNVGDFPALGFDDLAADQWQIYPNPSSGQVNISLPPGGWSLQVVDAKGMVVYKNNWNSYHQPKPLNLKHLPEGLYMFYFNNGKQQAIKKVVLN